MLTRSSSCWVAILGMAGWRRGGMYRGAGSRQAGGEVVVMSCHVPGPMHGPGAWTWNMAPVYTHAQSPISTISLLRPSTVIRYVAVYANSPRAYAYACTTPSSTYPPTHLRRVISKQHLSESGPWLLPAGSRGWSAGAQIGARLTRLFPACHCQCLVSLRAPVSPPPPRPLSLRAFAFLLFAPTLPACT
jgi:hypothetical protein